MIAAVARLRPGSQLGPLCGECARVSSLVYGRDVYLRGKLAKQPFWACVCGARVGCHPDSTRPLGTPASPRLRSLRNDLHAVIDPLWRDQAPVHHRARAESDAYRLRQLARQRVYAFMAEALQINPRDCHVAMFDIARCETAMQAMSAVTYADIAEHANRRLRRGIS